MIPFYTRIVLGIIWSVCFKYSLLFSQNINSAKKVDYRHHSALKILDRLYSTSGYQNSKKPKLSIVNSTKFAASYNPITNTIKLEEKLYKICADLGKDSVHALAYVIAHELSHSIAKSVPGENNNSNFIQLGFTHNVIEQDELNADVQGGFLCYLAGYDPSKVVDPLIDRIYSHYKLNLFQKNTYPSKSLRKQSLRLMMEKVEGLIQVFETAFILTIQSEYQLAEECYKYILNNYKGAEIYNNLGVTKAYLAMTQFFDDSDVYSYPFELDINSSLYKIRLSRGNLSYENIIMRKKILNSALELFKQAFSLNAENQQAQVNIMSCLNLMGEPKAAIRFFDSIYLDKTSLMTNDEESQKILLVLGISYALTGSDECKPYFNTCIQSGTLPIQQFAINNLEIASKTKKIIKTDQVNCPIEDKFILKYSYFGPIKSNSSKTLVLNNRADPLKLNYISIKNQSFIQLTNSLGTMISISRKSGNDTDRLNLSAVVKTAGGKPNLNYVPGFPNQYLQCESSNILYKLNRQGSVLERIKFERLY